MTTRTELQIRYLLIQLEHMNVEELGNHIRGAKEWRDFYERRLQLLAEIDRLFAQTETPGYKGPENSGAIGEVHVDIGNAARGVSESNYVSNQALAEEFAEETGRIHWPADSLRSEQSEPFYPPGSRFLTEDDAIENMAPTQTEAHVFRSQEARTFLSDERIKGRLEKGPSILWIDQSESSSINDPRLLESDDLSVWTFGEKITATITDPATRARIRAFIQTGDPLGKQT